MRSARGGVGIDGRSSWHVVSFVGLPNLHTEMAETDAISSCATIQSRSESGDSRRYRGNKGIEDRSPLSFMTAWRHLARPDGQYQPSSSTSARLEACGPQRRAPPCGRIKGHRSTP